MLTRLTKVEGIVKPVSANMEEEMNNIIQLIKPHLSLEPSSEFPLKMLRNC